METSSTTQRRRSRREYTTVFNGERWVVVRARPCRRTRMPLRGIGVAIIVLFLTKGAVLAYLGPDGHRTRMITLASDSFFYQAQAWLMQSDPLSRFVAAQLRPLMR